MAVTTQELVDEVAQIRAELETYKAVVQAIKDALAAAQEAGVNAIDGDAVKAALDGLEADVPKGE